MAFREIRAEELSFNPFDKIGKEWMLITAGDEASHNTMTASWGGLGIMWGKKSCDGSRSRPQRYTERICRPERGSSLRSHFTKKSTGKRFQSVEQIRSGLREGKKKKPDSHRIY